MDRKFDYVRGSAMLLKWSIAVAFRGSVVAFGFCPVCDMCSFDEQTRTHSQIASSRTEEWYLTSIKLRTKHLSCSTNASTECIVRGACRPYNVGLICH